MMPPDEFAAMLRRPLAALPDPLPLRPVARPFRAVVAPPGSKSLANRVLLLAALARGGSCIENLPRGADDVEVMIASLRALGVEFREFKGDPGTLRVTGLEGRLRGGATLDLHNAGTAARFLAAAACLADAPVVLGGAPRLCERPMSELIGMLHALGIPIDDLGAPDHLPIRVHPARPAGGELRIGRTLSSQFVSAIIMLAPFTRDGVTFWFEPGLTSPAYIDMTLALLRAWHPGGVEGDRAGGLARVRPGIPHARAWPVEPDASGAAPFWAAAAVVAGSSCRVPGLSRRDEPKTTQGDAAFAGALGAMGASSADERGSITVESCGTLRGADLDLSNMPDTAMALAAAACFAESATTIRGLRTLRVKETDRVAALVTELSKLGVRVEPFAHDGVEGGRDEGLRVIPPPGGIDGSPGVPPVEFDTYDDHRMAMALALIGLRRPGVFIRNPRCVEKTYPGFWRDWAKLYE